MPGLLSSLAPIRLPAGTRLEIPPSADRQVIASSLGSHIRADGAALVLVDELPILAPPAPLTTKRKRTKKEKSE